MEQTKVKSGFQEMINSGKPVLVDFFATWCGPCKMMAPALEELKKKMGDRIHILKIDVDKNQAAAMQFSIQGVPTLIVFHHGKPVWRQSGVLSASQLEQVMQNFL